ncbi:MAG: hypothetical protein JXB07_04470 [Anaerolineae bacterium]|nr:hypothetical protein [Anaerolineae bacterium]
MSHLSRKAFLKTLTFASASAVLGCTVSPPQVTLSPTPRTLRGDNLSGWEMALGDARYACPGEPAVSPADIETIHTPGYSELRANIQRRAIMAHNITFKRVIDETALQALHSCRYRFRISQIPLPDITTEFNAQTFEGGLFIWDGHQTRLDYGMAFQWSLNPWDAFGDLRTWTGALWDTVGHIPVDTQWHEVEIDINFQQQTGALLIDDITYSTSLSQTQKSDDWGSEIAARLQAEIVSIYPGASCMQAMHKAEVKDWFWSWDYAGA